MKLSSFLITGTVSLALVLSAAPKTEARNIREFDDITNVYARILDGSIAKYVRPQYLTIRDGLELLDEGGYQASMSVLSGPYAKSCADASCSAIVR